MYKTGRGRYFLHGSGGALSKYAISLAGNATGGSERIDPLSNEEAQEWLVETENIEALEEHFGDQIEVASRRKPKAARRARKGRSDR